MQLTTTATISVFQAALDYAQAQPPFCVDLQPLHRSSDYIGSVGPDVEIACEHARKSSLRPCFDILDHDRPGSVMRLHAEFASRCETPFSGTALLGRDGRDLGFQLFSVTPLMDERTLEISMNYVYVDPKRRGAGYRDAIQTCLFGALLLTGMEREFSVSLKFRQVKNPNNVVRYEAAGFEEVPEWAETEDDDTSFACYLPNRNTVSLPSSYQRLFFTSDLRRYLLSL